MWVFVFVDGRSWHYDERENSWTKWEVQDRLIGEGEKKQEEIR